MAEKKKKSGDRKIAQKQQSLSRLFRGGQLRGRASNWRARRSSPSGMGNVNLKDAFCIIKDGQMYVHGMHISPYEKGNIFNRDPRRPRRLLMHKREIQRLFAKIKQDGYALVPLSRLLQRPQGEGGGRPVQGQKAL